MSSSIVIAVSLLIAGVGLWLLGRKYRSSQKVDDVVKPYRPEKPEPRAKAKGKRG